MGILKDKLKKLLKGYIEELNVAKDNNKNSITISFFDLLIDDYKEDLDNIKKSEEKNKKKK